MDLSYKNISFVHISDLHIGFKFKNASFSVERGEERRHELLTTLFRVIKFIDEKHIDFLFISGDAFESKYITGADLADINYNFGKIPECDIVLIAGNHDPLSSSKIYDKINWQDNVHIIKEDFESFVFEEKACIVSGNTFSDESKKPLDFDLVPKPEKDYFNFLLLHGNVFTNDEYCYIDKKQLKKLGYDYIALGHIHKHEFIADNIAYAGSLEPLDFGETGEHGFILGELGEDGEKFEFVPFAKRSFVKLEIELTGEDVHTSLIEKIKEKSDKYEDDFIRIIFTGYKSLTLDLSKESLEKDLDFYYFEIKDETKFDIDLDLVVSENEDGFIGRFVESFAEDDLRDELVKEAYELGIRMLYEEQGANED